MQLLYELPREVPVNELQGRKFFRDLIKWFPEISLSDDTPHENQYWAAYTITTPKLVDTNNLSDESITVSSFSDNNKHYMVLSFKDQDSNNTDLPIKSRTLLQNILQQLRVENE
jgi:hypothetical protein